MTNVLFLPHVNIQYQATVLNNLGLLNININKNRELIIFLSIFKHNKLIVLYFYLFSNVQKVIFAFPHKHCEEYRTIINIQTLWSFLYPQQYSHLSNVHIFLCFIHGFFFFFPTFTSSTTSFFPSWSTLCSYALQFYSLVFEFFIIIIIYYRF